MHRNVIMSKYEAKRIEGCKENIMTQGVRTDIKNIRANFVLISACLLCLVKLKKTKQIKSEAIGTRRVK